MPANRTGWEVSSVLANRMTQSPASHDNSTLHILWLHFKSFGVMGG